MLTCPTIVYDLAAGTEYQTCIKTHAGRDRNARCRLAQLWVSSWSGIRAVAGGQTRVRSRHRAVRVC